MTEPSNAISFPPDLTWILRLVLADAERSIEPTALPEEVEDGKAVAAAVRMLGYPLSDGAGTALWDMWCLDQRAGWLTAGRDPSLIINSIRALCESIRDGFGPFIVVGEGTARAVVVNPKDV
jgi:hypothetical protein